MLQLPLTFLFKVVFLYICPPILPDGYLLDTTEDREPILLALIQFHLVAAYLCHLRKQKYNSHRRVRQFSTLVNAPAGQLDCCTAGTEQLKHPAEPTQRQTAYTATCAAVIAPSCICSLSHIWRWDICCFGTNILPDLHSLHQQFLVITRVPICSKYKAKPLSITHCILLQNEPQTTSMYSDSSGDVWKAWGCGIQTVYLIPSAFPKWILVTRLNALKQFFPMTKWMKPKYTRYNSQTRISVPI